MRVADLRPSDRNPRTISAGRLENLKRSLEQDRDFLDARPLLANSTRRGDVVLDPFAGSGSTMVACELLGRRAALIELEPRFVDVIVRRWEELSPGNRAERVRG
jgi:adenine-specific DNA methylase